MYIQVYIHQEEICFMEKRGAVGVEFLEEVVFDLLAVTGEQKSAHMGKGVFVESIKLGLIH